MTEAQSRFLPQQNASATEVEIEENDPDEFSDLPKLVYFGDKIIELDESMLSVLCNECEQLGYCKRNTKAHAGRG
jgi:hypothetical protein